MRDTFFPSGKRFPTEKHQISPLHISKIGSNLDAFSYISLLRCIPGNNNIMHEQHRTNQTAAIYSFGRSTGPQIGNAYHSICSFDNTLHILFQRSSPFCLRL